MKNTRLLALAAIIVFAATAAFAQRCSAPEAASLEKDVAKYKTVTVSVDDCFVTLSGSVNKLSDAWDIENKFRKYPWASRVANYITVIGGPPTTIKSARTSPGRSPKTDTAICTRR